MKVFLETINTFIGLPMVKYPVDVFSKFGAITIVQSVFGHQKNYLASKGRHILLRRYENDTAFVYQNLYQKIEKYIQALFYSYRALARNDTQIVYVIDLYCLFLFLLARKFSGRRNFILIYHQFELKEPARLNRLEQFFLRYISRNCGEIDLVVMPEQNRLEYFMSQLTGKKEAIRTFIFPNTNDYDPPAETVEKPKGTKTIVGHIGSVGSEHYIRHFVEAAKLLPQDCKVWFTGNLDPSIEKLLTGAGLSNVKYFGHVPHDKLADFYRQFDVGLILYRDTSLNFRYCAPNKLYEYWSHGIPVVAHRLPGLTPVFGIPEQGLLTDMEHFENIASAIQECVLKNTPAQRQRLVRYFQEHLHAGIYMRQLEAIINGLLAAKHLSGTIPQAV